MYCPIDFLLEKWVNHLIPCRFFEKTVNIIEVNI